MAAVSSMVRARPWQLTLAAQSGLSASRNMCAQGCHGRRIRRSNAADRIKGGSRAIVRSLRASELAVDQAYAAWASIEYNGHMTRIIGADAPPLNQSVRRIL